MRIILVLVTGILLQGASFHSPVKSRTHIVKIEGMKFTPKILEIKPGETVKWVNASNTPHNVVASNGSFESEMLHSQGKVFEHTFSEKGKFYYYCQPHKMMGMKGIILVKTQ